MGHVSNGIGADQKKQHGFVALFANLPQSLDRITQAAALDFEFAHPPGGLRLDGELQHFQPLGVGCVRTFSLQRLDGCRREPNLVERCLLLTRTSQRKMAVVHRVETTAVDAETHEKVNDRESTNGFRTSGTDAPIVTCGNPNGHW